MEQNTLFAQIEASMKIDNLDDAIRPIQDILGQDDGGAASIFFSDVEPEHWKHMHPTSRKHSLLGYVIYELGMIEFAS